MFVVPPFTIFIAKVVELNKLTLDNGLRVVHCYDASTQMVAMDIAYDVGARDEHPLRTGFAHLFEHLMFGGSANIPDYDTPLQMAGGESNAWTNNDITNFYLTLPACNAETAFWLESDRMWQLDPSGKSLDVQREVVMEEFKQRCLNRPYGDVSHLLRSAAYQIHPYRWPTLGKELSHIASATAEEVADFFERHYAPNNAVLAVTGRITWDDVQALAERWFGPIPSRPLADRRLPQEPPQTEERRMTVERNVPIDGLYMAYHVAGRDEGADFRAADMLSDILGNGASSRLTRRLVQQRQLFSSIDAFVSGERDPGLLHIWGRPSAGVTLEQAEAAVRYELEQLADDLIPPRELEKVKNKYESTHIFGNLNYLNVATNLALYELMGEAEDIMREVQRYRAVTAEHLQAVAQQVFRPDNATILYYRAAKK